MSEYEYYEFQALDRPLDEKAMDDLRALSSRATITPTSFVNVYNYGSFRGNPRTLVEKYFDAFVYVANWGTHELVFRLPRSAVDVKSLSRYCVDDGTALRTKGRHVILEVCSESEDGEWQEGEGWLAALVPLRQDILEGDLRCLYLAWLNCLECGDVTDDTVEPPVPAGMRGLSARLRALTEFLRLDEDLIEAAATRSEDREPAQDKESRAEILSWIGSLSDAKKDKLLADLMQGDAAAVRTILLRAFREHRAPRRRVRESSRRTVGELRTAAAQICAEKRRRAAERAGKERERREREKARAQAARLKKLRKTQAAAWRRVGELIATRQPKNYDAAVELLCDLQELGNVDGKERKFESRLERIRSEQSRKTSLLERLDKAGLVARN